MCAAGALVAADAPLCLSAIGLADPSAAIDEVEDLTEGHIRGPGCKHDGGPLWVSIPIVDDPVVGGVPYSQTIWARFFQRAPSKPILMRKRPRITSYNNPERYQYSNRYESVGRDQQEGYLPRLGHSWLYSQTVARAEEELIECLRIALCDTDTAPTTN